MTTLEEDGPRPLVWIMAHGYRIPAGIEAHVLHYATEMRHHGFDTKVVVFSPLPGRPHRFLEAMRARGIPIVSVDEAGAWRRRIRLAGRFLPWLLFCLARRQRPVWRHFVEWVTGGLRGTTLSCLLDADRPDIIHIFGRLQTDLWNRFPAERTVFHEMMTGTVDAHWTESELEAFRGFAARIARYFAPGEGVAANVRREFGVTRRIDPIFTMVPDELGTEDRGQGTEDRGQGTEDRGQGTGDGGRGLRFGVLCRLTEQKGISYLLEALRLFRDRHGDVSFLFAGHGNLEGMIEEYCAAHGLDNVRVERVDSAKDTLCKMDVFVHPSVDDAMPVSIGEALMCRVPVVASRVGGIPDLVRDGVEGFLIAPRQVGQILEGMERFHAMPADEFQAYRERARVRYEEVCLPRSVGSVVAFHYREILSAAPRPASRHGKPPEGRE